MPNRFIQKLTSFSELDAKAVTALEAVTSRPRRFLAKQDVIREGDETGPVFVMLSGWGCRYKILPSGTRQVMAFMVPGDACDLHINLVARMDHNIQALTPSEIAIISRVDMERLLEEHSSFARAMYIAQLVDEGTLRAWIVSMGRRSSVERVAHLMCELYLRLREIDMTHGHELVMPLSQLVLADALGMTPVHINRVLKDLRLTGAMELKRGSLIIKDPGKLVRIAGFDENYLHRRMEGEGSTRSSPFV